MRTRLDELKRQEVSRLRMLLKAKLDSTNTQSEWTHFPVERESIYVFIPMEMDCIRFNLKISGGQLDGSREY